MVVASTWTKSVTSLHFFLRLSWDQYTQVGLSLPLAENRIKLSFSLRERFLFVVLNSRAYIMLIDCFYYCRWWGNFTDYLFVKEREQVSEREREKLPVPSSVS